MFLSDEDFIIVEVMEEPGFLRLFDEVVISGTELYDGKIVL
jgi:hypothetical protein